MNRILIVRLGALGDIVHAIPAFQLLRRRFPNARIDWLTEPAYRELLECVPGLHRVWTADTKSWRRRPRRALELLELRRSLRRERFEVALDFQGLLKSALLARLAGPQRLIGFRPERFKERAAGWFYHQKASGEADLSRHVVSTNIRLAAVVAGDDQADPRIDLELPGDALSSVTRRLAEVDAPRPIVLSPGAGWETKLWPPEQFARLGPAIEQQLGFPTVYTYGPGEDGLIDRIRRHAAPQELRVLPTSLLELAALCRSSRLVVAGDTGPLHLAAALGTPTVAVMGPTGRVRNGPFDPNDQVVQWRLHCSDCYKRRCEAFFCMNIPVYEVLRAVSRRLQGR